MILFKVGAEGFRARGIQVEAMNTYQFQSRAGLHYALQPTNKQRRTWRGVARVSDSSAGTCTCTNAFLDSKWTSSGLPVDYRRLPSICKADFQSVRQTAGPDLPTELLLSISHVSALFISSRDGGPQTTEDIFPHGLVSSNRTSRPSPAGWVTSQQVCRVGLRQTRVVQIPDRLCSFSRDSSPALESPGARENQEQFACSNKDAR